MRCQLVCVLALFVLSGAANAARILKQATYTTTKGQTPIGKYAIADKAESGAAAASLGIRYNAGAVTAAGPMVPGARAGASTAALSGGGITAQSGNTMGEASVNLGHMVVAHTGEGARAVAGSAMHHTAEEGRGVAVASQTATFRPATVRTRGSTAFTDVSHTSAAVNGMGDGPAALAWGEEVGAMARSSRDAEPRNLNNKQW